MDYNYHTHTVWCSHASGTSEEYVKRAIECGIKHLGFSDHFPLKFPNGKQLYWRVQVENVALYVSEINTLKEKYKDKIDIKIGFEMEYYPDFFKDMKRNAIEYGGEYVILGQHFVNSETEYPKNDHSINKTTSVEKLQCYANGVSEAIRTGFFTYVAHPDIFNFIGNEQLYRHEMEKICEASRECDIPLEINLLGIREKRIYPKGIFWEMAGKVGSPVTFGFDAHTIEAVYDAPSIPIAEELVKKYKLNYIGEPRLVSIRDFK